MNAKIADLKYVPTSKIRVKEGFNPRKAKSAAKIVEITDSIRQEGVLQPILLRPDSNGGFWVVAGHTRFEVACSLGLPEIPACIREMDDVEAETVALLENIHRSDMSPVDEGIAAKRLLHRHKNDAAEVLRILGWSRKKLEARVLLTHAIEDVSQALTDGLISIGHAELLCGLRHQAQGAALKRVLDQKLSVTDLKERLQAAALLLTNAVFDVTGCNGCPSNSTTQSNLFGEAMEKARCLNPTCFNEKTEKKLANLLIELKEQVPVVKFDRDVPADSYRALYASDVGEVQYASCKSCEHLGALVSTKIGQAATVLNNQCFNLVCHNEKKAAFQKSIRVPKEKLIPAKNIDNGVPAKGKPTEVVAVAESLSQALIDKHHAIHRVAAGAAVRQNSAFAKALAVLSMIADGKIEVPKPPEGWPHSLRGEGRATAMDILAKMPEEMLDFLIVDMATTLVERSKESELSKHPEKDTFGSCAVAVCKLNQVRLETHFIVDKEYLGLLTKGAIEEILVASGFKAHVEAQEGGQKKWKVLLSMKKAEMIGTVADSGFNFHGYIPPNLAIN